jgi:hypothetical protein
MEHAATAMGRTVTTMEHAGAVFSSTVTNLSGVLLKRFNKMTARLATLRRNSAPGGESPKLPKTAHIMMQKWSGRPLHLSVEEMATEIKCSPKSVESALTKLMTYCPKKWPRRKN